VPPHHSSQECAACGFTHPDNRPRQAEFICQRCGNRDNADFNAGKVIAKRGIHLLLSGEVAVKEKKRCAIKRNKVGAGSSEPAALPLTLVEICVRRPGLSVPAQQSVKQETPTTSRRL
jgi:putative transposase